MRLQDNFYTVEDTQLQGDQLQFQIQINPSHRIFEGHFPGNPVTPGVVQMELVKELIGLHLGKMVQMQSMSNCKFLNILNPNDHPNVLVNIQLKEENGQWKASASIAHEDLGFLKMSAIYA